MGDTLYRKGIAAASTNKQQLGTLTVKQTGVLSSQAYMTAT